MRRLSREERDLWRQVRRSVRPLRTTAPDPVEASPEPKSESPAAGKPASAGPPRAAAVPQVPAPPPLTPLDDRTRRRVSRGIVRVEARIDLHGMRQDQAFDALAVFLRRSQERGARLVLVITGKGRQPEAGHGVLRRLVPAWLARPEFRKLVLGLEPAGPRHGGAGALYVRLRRRRERDG